MNWFFLNSGKCEPAFNMALDETLLEDATRICKPVLRFYGWTEPAATFGYFQKFSEVERATHLRPLIRRPTGGGIVPHDVDWTYSFVVPPNQEWHMLKAEESYRRIHEWIQAAFTKLKIDTELASSAQKSAPGQCFAGHEKFDLLWHGKKIAGAAQRRNKFGLLIQGSVQPPLPKIVRADWEKSMRDAAADLFDAAWKDFPPGDSSHKYAEELARQKYAQIIYNERR
jgi:lipoate-protein ligase A